MLTKIVFCVVHLIFATYAQACGIFCRTSNANVNQIVSRPSEYHMKDLRCNIRQKDEYGKTLLFYARKKNDTKIINTVLQSLFDEEKQCPICFEEDLDPNQLDVSNDICCHIMCKQCKKQLNTCPICRAPVDHRVPCYVVFLQCLQSFLYSPSLRYDLVIEDLFD